jgi:hypothetical protein
VWREWANSIQSTVRIWDMPGVIWKQQFALDERAYAATGQDSRTVYQLRLRYKSPPGIGSIYLTIG